MKFLICTISSAKRSSISFRPFFLEKTISFLWTAVIPVRYFCSKNSFARMRLTPDDDHIGAAAEWKERCPDLQILASCAEAPYPSGDRKDLRLQQGEALQPQLPEEQRTFGEQSCERYRNLNTISVAFLLRDGDRFDWGDGCEIIATPGHTPSHISIRSLDNEYMITGDAAVLEGRQPAIANPEFCLDQKEAQHPLERIA